MRALLPALLLLAPTVTALEPVARVTTDSREYCAELARRFAALPNAQAEPARRLAEEGVRLCDAGHPRTGVAKLRRAIRAARMGE